MTLADALHYKPNRLWTLVQQVGVTAAVCTLPDSPDMPPPWDSAAHNPTPLDAPVTSTALPFNVSMAVALPRSTRPRPGPGARPPGTRPGADGTCARPGALARRLRR
jgi:hypothetical protein